MPMEAPTQMPMIKASNPITNKEISATVSFTDIGSEVGVAANGGKGRFITTSIQTIRRNTYWAKTLGLVPSMIHSCTFCEYYWDH